MTITLEGLFVGSFMLLLGVIGWQYRELKKKEYEIVGELKRTMSELSLSMTAMAESFRAIVDDVKQRVHDQEVRCQHKIGCKFESELLHGSVIIKERRKSPRLQRSDKDQTYLNGGD